MTIALDSSFFEFFEFWTNQFASFCIHIRSHQCYFCVCQSGEILNKKAFFSVYLNFFIIYYNKFHVAVRLFSLSKCGKNISDTLSCASYATFLFLPHFAYLFQIALEIMWLPIQIERKVHRAWHRYHYRGAWHKGACECQRVDMCSKSTKQEDWTLDTIIALF